MAGSQFFYLRKNSQNENANNERFTIINTSVPYKSYKQGSNGLLQENGWKYRPAIRMQFTPVMQNTDPTASNRPWVYPTKLKLMKKSDYSDDLLDMSEIGEVQKRGFTYCQRFKGKVWQYPSVSKESMFYCDAPCNSKDERKNNSMHGIAFHQYVAYEQLNLKFEYTNDNGTIIENVYVYETDASRILYQGSRVVTTNFNQHPFQYDTENNYVEIDLHYVYPISSSTYKENHVFATLYINKSYYQQNGRIYNLTTNTNTDQLGNEITTTIAQFVATDKQFRVCLRFKNFIAQLDDSVKDLQITDLPLLNGEYKRLSTIKNAKSVYYNQLTNYYIYNIIDAQNESYWVITYNVVLDDTINQNIQSIQQVYFYAKQLITTQTNKWKYQQDYAYGYDEINVQQTNVPVVSYVVKQGANSLQLTYLKQNASGYFNLFDQNNNNLYYWIQSQGNYRWIKLEQNFVNGVKLQETTIFTRTTKNNQISNNIKGIPYTSANQISSFKINRPSQTQNSFSIYFDYTKQIELDSGNKVYMIDGIQDYFNEQVVLSIEFNTWEQSSDNIQHDNSTHYKYAFGHVDDYYKTSKKGLYLLKQENDKYIDFLVNNKQNQKNQDSSLKYLNGTGFPKYINYNDKYYANVIQNDDYNITGQKFRRVIKYRYSQRQFLAQDSDILVPWRQVSQPQKKTQYEQVDSIQNANVYIQFANNAEQTKQVFLQVADNQFNVSQVVQGNLTVYTTKPSSTFIKITGTNGNNNYTGVYIDDATQQFTIDNKVVVQFAAYSEIKLYYKITGDIYKQYLQKNADGQLQLKSLDQYTPFNADDNVLTLQLIPQLAYTPKIFNRANENTHALKQFIKQGNVVTNKIDKSAIQSYSPQGILNANNKKQITVTFRDQAGNTQSITGSIVLNTRLFETKNRNLRQATSTYDLQVYKTANNVNTLIARTDTKKSSTKRNWRDVFYPDTHGYPRLANGDIDVTQALKISQATDSFDPVVRNNGQIVYDEQGRTTTIWANRKKYPTMVSSYGDISNRYSGFVYWIIDNKGYGDITLQFQHFYLDSIAYGPPYNQNLGQRPDSLIVYDASQQGCVMQSVNQVGQATYTLIDTTKLKQLQIYTGSGSNVMSLLTGTVNATAQGQFKTQPFSTQRLCLIFYSDYRNSTDSATSPIGSGFKLKAAKQIVRYWQNFDIDSHNGLVWVHTSSQNQKDVPSGLSVDQLKVTYDHYSTNLQIDYDQGSVIFDEQPRDKDGKPTDVFATYTYYTYDAKDRPPVRTFMLDADDLVDYADVNLYYLPNGTTPIKTGQTTPIYVDTNEDGKGQYSTYNAGKLNNHFFIDKDRGVIQFNNGVGLTNDQRGLVPRGRLFADYRYHTYDRLGNDGYSDFQFNDSMLIAGITTQYPDYTWGDIKIVNQGDAQLRDGRLIFLARGQVQNNVITSVLDYDRPWDVQQGTAQQTYDKVAVVIRKNYAWNSYACTRDQAKNLYRTSDVNIFPDVMKPKEIFYGRIVYCLGGSNDSYPTTTAGRKTFSSEISGRFIQVD